MKHSGVCLGFLLLLSACIERIPLDESLSGAPLLVVDGEITNAAGSYEVTLSYVSPTLKAYEGEVLSGAEVYITDQEGNQASLMEDVDDPGTYATDSASFRGEAQNTYQLHIITPDGKTYASLPETMPTVAPIDSIYFRLESRPKISESGTTLDEWGLQFYLKTGQDINGPAFYRWKWVETYQFSAPLVLPMQLNVPICYQSSTSPRSIAIASTAGLRRGLIEQQKLNFALKTGLRFQRRYSLFVQQYALTERAYTFWESVQAQQEDVGSIFSPPPAPIIGNMYNTGNERELVLGYFQASSVTEKRIFVTRSDVPNKPGGKPGGFGDCGPNTLEPAEYCYDCSLIPGVTTETPAFW